jgi:hypothetical protein
MDERWVILIREPEWDPATVSQDEWQAAMEGHGAFAAAVEKAGARITSGAALQGTSAAVRIDPGTDGTAAVFTDGPFGETKEVVSGFYELAVRDGAQARELAALCPTSGWLELYPVLPIPDM